MNSVCVTAIMQLYVEKENITDAGKKSFLKSTTKFNWISYTQRGFDPNSIFPFKKFAASDCEKNSFTSQAKIIDRILNIQFSE